MAEWEEERDDNPITMMICNGISKYYRSKGVEYNYLFSNHIFEAGCDDEFIDGEFENDTVKTSIMVQFDEDFPRSHIDKMPKTEEIYQLIDKIVKMDGNVEFDVHLTKYKMQNFLISQTRNLKKFDKFIVNNVQQYTQQDLIVMKHFCVF